MNRYTFILVLLLSGVISFSSFAQVSINPGIAYGSEIENLGITVGAEYFVSEKVSIAPDIIYYFTKKESTVFAGSDIEIKANLWELNGNVHYYFVDNSSISVYGLGGLNYSHAGVKYKQTEVGSGIVEAEFEDDDGEIGVNLGVGANFSIRQNFTPFTELKYVGVSTDQLVITAGVRFDLQ
jgi:opacity protein-like surface antigen